MQKLIDWFKDAINRHEDWKNFNFNFSPTESYEDMSGFYKEVFRNFLNCKDIK